MGADSLITWGKYRGHYTYREAAAKDPRYAAWAATKISGIRGALFAFVLAEREGITC